MNVSRLTTIWLVILFIGVATSPLLSQSEATLVFRKQVTTTSISALSLAPEGLGFLALTENSQIYVHNEQRDSLFWLMKAPGRFSMCYLDSVYVLGSIISDKNISIEIYDMITNNLIRKENIVPPEPDVSWLHIRSVYNIILRHRADWKSSYVHLYTSDVFKEDYIKNGTYFYGGIEGTLDRNGTVVHPKNIGSISSFAESDDEKVRAYKSEFTIFRRRMITLFNKMFRVLPSPLDSFPDISLGNVFFSTSHRYFLVKEGMFNYAYLEPIRPLRYFNELSRRLPRKNYYTTLISRDNREDFGIVFIPEDSLVANYSRNTTSTITTTDINRDGSLVAFGTKDGYVEIWRLPSELQTPNIKPDFFIKGFSGNPITLRLQEKALFVNSTFLEDSNATFQWDFGNGQTSDKLIDSTRYDKPGNYTVTLVITYPDGRKDTVRKENHIIVRDFSSPISSYIFSNSRSKFTSIELSYDNKYALAMQKDLTVSFIDVEKETLIRSWKENTKNNSDLVFPYTFFGKSNNITSIRKAINPFTNELIKQHSSDIYSDFFIDKVNSLQILSDIQGNNIVLGFNSVKQLEDDWGYTIYENRGSFYRYNVNSSALALSQFEHSMTTTDIPGSLYNIVRYRDSLFIASTANNLFVWNIDSRRSNELYNSNIDNIVYTRLRVASDGYHIVTADGIFDLFSETLIYPIDFRTNRLGNKILGGQPFEVLPDGRRYLKIDSSQLELYDTLTKVWQPIGESQLYQQYVSALSFNGKKLITAGENGTILFWDLSKVITSIEEREYGNECRCLAYPQPSYTNKVTFAIDIGEPTPMQIEIVDIFGQVVHKAEIERAGNRRLYQWNTLNMAGEQVRSGVYYVQITTGQGGRCGAKIMIGR